jgi:type II secretory pathway pseudopilin PulG
MHGQIQKAHNSNPGWRVPRETFGPHLSAPGLMTSLPRSGFTLIEMVGVFAVTAILASLLIPKVFESIHRARVVQAAMGVGTAKTTLISHVAKFGSLAVDGSVSPPTAVVLDGSDVRASDFDLVLLQEGLLDAPFGVKIGFGYLELLAGTWSAVAPDGTNAAYDLDGFGLHNDACGNTVAEAVIVDVTLEDARALNNVIDGLALGEDNSGNDFLGRVKYAKPSLVANGNSNGNGNGNGTGNGNGRGNGKAWAYGHHRENTVDLHIYLTHK